MAAKTKHADRLHGVTRCYRPLIFRLVETKVLLSLALFLGLARVPEWLATSAGIDLPCATDCENANDQGQCPPYCKQGACSKVAPTLTPEMDRVPPPEAIAQAITALPSSLIAVLPSGGVFHPPRV